MGRGRQKAKHSPTVNYDQLERELTGHGHGEADYSKWADYEPDGESADDSADEYETHDQSKRA
jgi:hypothetical protein